MKWPGRRRGPEYWFRLHASSYAEMDAGRLDGAKAFERGVKAQWELIACGASAVPYALRMLQSSDAEIRGDGAGVLSHLGQDEEVVEAVIAALERETADEARDSLVLALGELGDRRAIPSLAQLIRSESTDDDTRFTAAQSLGRLVRRRFDRQEDPVAVALDWLDAHGE